MARCPNCGKKLGEDERYCFHCENDLSKVVDKEQSPKCFIATAAYGSPFATEINILREFRDRKLKNNFLGKLFIRFYYKISPPVADFIQKSEVLKKIIRMALKPIIKLLLRLR
jgi:predicted amidophosphoribosyltransferase